MRLGGPAGARVGVGAQDLDVAPRRDVVLGAGSATASARSSSCGIDDHVGVGELAELEQLGVGEGRLGGSAAADDTTSRTRLRASTSRAWSAVSVGRELGRGEHEHARDIERHVAVADHHSALGREQVDLEVGVVGMAVVPADELGRGVRAGEVFAGDAQRAVRGRAGGVDDRVIVGQQVLARDVLAEGDVAEEAKARVRGGLLIDARDGLDLRVVGRHAGADEPPWRGQALEHVHLECGRRGVLEQVSGGVEAGRAGADHGDADGDSSSSSVMAWVGTAGRWARPDSNGRPPRCKRGALAN